MADKKKEGIDSDKIKVDDAGRPQVEEGQLDESQLDQVAGGQGGGGCRIQTSSSGCGIIAKKKEKTGSV